MVMNNSMRVLTLFPLWLFFSLLSSSHLKCNSNNTQYESRLYWWQLSYPWQAKRLLFSHYDRASNNNIASRYWPWQSYSLQSEKRLISHYDQESTNKKGGVDDGFFANLRRHRKLLGKTQLFDFTPFKHHVPVQPELDAEEPEADPLYGEEKRLVPTGPNPLHH